MDMKELRQKADVRAEDVAVRLQIALSTVRNWEQGRTIPKLRIDQFADLLVLYQCSFEELLQSVQESQKSKSQ